MAPGLGSVLRRAAEAHPDAVALVDGYHPHRRLTYAALHGRVLQWAAALRADPRLAPGAVQALMAPNGFIHLEAMFAASYAGLIHASIPSMLNARAVAHLVADFGVQLLLFHPSRWAKVRSVRQCVQTSAGGPNPVCVCVDSDGAAVPEDFPGDVLSYEALLSGYSSAAPPSFTLCPSGCENDVAGNAETGDGSVAIVYETNLNHLPDHHNPTQQPSLLIFTSGSTGAPKAAVVTAAMMLHHLAGHHPRIRPEPGHPYLLNSDFSWVAAWIISCCLIEDGATIVVLPGYDRDRFWPLFLSLQPTVHFFLGALLVDMLDLPPADLQVIKSFFKLLMYGGSRYPRPLIQRAITLLGPEVQLMQVYSSTEAFQTIAFLSPEDHVPCPDPMQYARLLSVGRPRTEAGVLIVDDAGQPCPSGTVGHIALANPAPSTPGYFGNPAATALLLRHGRLITGDLGYLDGDGYLYITGRVADMIVTRTGLNVYPAELEDVVARLPEVRAVVAAGARLPAGHGFDRIAVFVVPRAGAAPAAVRERVRRACEEELGGHKVPDEVVCVERFPTGATNGKVDRRALVRLLAADPPEDCLCSA